MKRIRILAGIVIGITLTLVGCTKSNENYNEGITLQIQMNVAEDIGLLIIDYDANGTCGSGGTSNANGTLIKKDEEILYTLEEGWLEEPSHIDLLTLDFRIVTKYFEPNYENVYPEEYTKSVPQIQFPVEMGKTYTIEITGDEAQGYIATLK